MLVQEGLADDRCVPCSPGMCASRRGRTALAWAAANGRTAMARALVALGADLLATDLHGRVPRCLAQLGHHGDTVQVLSDLARQRLVKPDYALSEVA